MRMVVAVVVPCYCWIIFLWIGAAAVTRCSRAQSLSSQQTLLTPPLAALLRQRTGSGSHHDDEDGRLTTLDLHPTWSLLVDDHHDENVTTTSAIYPPHTHRHLQDFHRRRHLSRYEQQSSLLRMKASPAKLLLVEEVEDEMYSWNGEYDDDFFARIERRSHADDGMTNNHTNSSFSYHHHRHHRYRSLAGGQQLSQYQAVPLSQGYGTHFASVWVGSPTPQRKTVIVDTGSHYTAFPCTGCRNCGGNHHTDPYFDPTRSDSYHQLLCEECQDGVGCVHGACRFSQAYTEGSSWEAVQVKDQFYCGGTDVLNAADPQYQKYSITFMFGCQQILSGLFITQLADGIMGMSAHPATLPKKLFDEKKIPRNQFAMCFRRELGTSKRGVSAGSMTLGGYKTSLDTSQMVFAKNIVNIGWFTVYVKNIYVRPNGGLTAKSNDPLHHATIRVKASLKALNSGKGVIVDSGTTDTYLNKDVAKEFVRAWRKATGQKYSHNPMTLTPEQLRRLPTILIQCQAYSLDDDPSMDRYDQSTGYAGSLDPTSPNDLLIAVPATSYMDYNPVTKRYASRLYFTESAGGVLGSNTMQGHNVLFDWQNGRIGFAESSCAYDKQDLPGIGDDSGFSADCQVSDPILTAPCVDTVDRAICRQNPSNVALLGTETWTAVVESPGTDTGVLCTEASQRETHRPFTEFDMEPQISCDGHGTCQEVRTCALKCPQVQIAIEVKEVSDKDNVDNKCGDSEWSACDYGCRQTRIQTQLFSDGHCHEKSRETRPCHTGACAYADKCKVPYIVHGILLFRGGNLDHWSLHSEEVLAQALVAAAKALVPDPLFQAGDVNVVMALPWYLDQDELDSISGRAGRKKALVDYNNEDPANPQKLGTRVIVEVSVVDPAGGPYNGKTTTTTETGNNPLNELIRNITNNIPGMLQSSDEDECDKEHMYRLAKTALSIKNVFLDPSFMMKVHQELNNTASNGGGLTMLEFGAGGASTSATTADDNVNAGTNHDNTLPSSRVLSAWTVQRSIGETINYSGPRRSFGLQLLIFVENVVILTLMSILILMVWNWGTIMTDRVNAALSLRQQQQQQHHHLPVQPLVRSSFSHLSVSDDEIETSILLGTTTLDDEILDDGSNHHHHRQLELATVASHKLTTPKKRPRRRQT